jgi:hypothetical protein
MVELYTFPGYPDKNDDALRNAGWAALRRGALGVLALAFSPFSQAHATDGYFSEGYSIINQGMGRASIAYPRDTLAIATNPAGLFSVGNRVDLGIEYFYPDRGASITGNAFGPDQNFSANRLSNFFVPSVGYSHLVTPDFALGIAAYGNGALNTSYGGNPYARFGATGKRGSITTNFSSRRPPPISSRLDIRSAYRSMSPISGSRPPGSGPLRRSRKHPPACPTAARTAPWARVSRRHCGFP